MKKKKNSKSDIQEVENEVFESNIQEDMNKTLYESDEFEKSETNDSKETKKEYTGDDVIDADFTETKKTIINESKKNTDVNKLSSNQLRMYKRSGVIPKK